jgi:hypothetical protein
LKKHLTVWLIGLLNLHRLNKIWGDFGLPDILFLGQYDIILLLNF